MILECTDLNADLNDLSPQAEILSEKKKSLTPKRKVCWTSVVCNHMHVKFIRTNIHENRQNINNVLWYRLSRRCLGLMTPRMFLRMTLWSFPPMVGNTCFCELKHIIAVIADLINYISVTPPCSQCLFNGKLMYS